VSGHELMTKESTHTITVIIPTFNRRVQLQKAIESVLQERRVPVLVHVFDNASTDETEAYVFSLMVQDPRVRYLRRPENIGSTGNYQDALAHVSTAYFVPLADDDWLLPDFLHDAYQILETRAEVGAAVFVTEVRDAEGVLHGTYPSPLDQFRFGLLQPREHLAEWLRHGHYVWTSILWRQETLACLGAPYLCTGLPSDVDFQAQIFCEYPVYLRNQPGAVFFAHADQASRGFNASHITSWHSVFERLDREIARKGLFSPEEYLALRAIAEKRYKGAWSAPTGVSLPDREKVIAAQVAGFRLGDWKTAFSLIEGVKVQPRSVGREVFRLPLVGRMATASVAGTAADADELLDHVVGWMKQASEAIAQLEKDADRLEQEKDEQRVQLSAEIDRLAWQRNEVALELSICRRSEADALARADTSERQFLELAQKVQRWRSHPLVKMATKLGLRRFFR